MRALVAVLVALALVVGAVGGVVGAIFVTSASPVQPVADGGQASGPTLVSSQSNGQPQAGGNATYASLYERSIDSVVSLRVSTSAGPSQGSGFVYDDQDHVVTNEHVVAGADEVEVRFQRGDWRTGTVVGTDVYTDLAVVEVDDPPSYAEPLPVADGHPVTGQPVAALGSPFGLEGSITSGIVSGANRSMATAQGFSIPATVQTDAPINPGNSGGPLVSLDGTVVGVNRAKEGDNVGFAISASVVNRVVPELVADGEYRHTFVGVRTLPVTPMVAEGNGLETPEGVLVVDVLEDGPSTGTLQPSDGEAQVDGNRVPTGGDVIVAVDGTPVATNEDLSRHLLLHTKPGDTVAFTVVRDGERTNVSVTLDERPQP
ncbi:S1C family serine protease [Halobacteriaceae archaeon GCM10025711]